MKLQILAEGSTPKQRLEGEWGIAMLVDGTVMFDTFGHSDMMGNNIKRYGVNAKLIKTIVISHTHWDHVSGLRAVLPLTKSPDVYVPQYDAKVAENCEYYGSRILTLKNGGPVKPGITLTGIMKVKFENEVLFEQGMIAEGLKGQVLIVGCSHPGIINMVKRAMKITGRPLYAVAGGLHMKDSGKRYAVSAAAALKRAGVKKVYAGHCTGLKAEGELKRVFGGGFSKIKEGDILEL
ncbi:MAG: MBL fold metallo-hydrolase [Spirochaetia bacterium]|nr:MBL fold metallo-hydrolase [Spirochaetia bacterium]